MGLKPDETELIGNWIKEGSGVVGDPIATIYRGLP
jgi:hypothetical protein